MKETLSVYWQFLKCPHLLKLSKDKGNLWRDIFYLLLLNLLFAGIIIVIYTLLLSFNLIKKYEEYDIFKFGLPVALAIGCVFAPLTEELLFRWQLRKRRLSIYFVIISFGIFLSSFFKNDYARFFIIVGTIIFFVVGVMVMEKRSKKQAYRVANIYYVFLFYYTAFIFGYVHISNVNGLTIHDPSIVLYISSQIFGGLALGYVRLKYGLRYSMLMHGFINLVLIPIAWVLR